MTSSSATLPEQWAAMLERTTRGKGAADLPFLMARNLLSTLGPEDLDMASTMTDPSTGYTLGTWLACRLGQSYHTDCYQPKNLIPLLAKKGVDLNHPDAHGRIASWSALQNSQAMLTVEDLVLAVQQGADLALVDDAGCGVLSVEFVVPLGQNVAFLACMYEALEAAIARLPPAEQALRLERMTPRVHDAHLPWWNPYRARIQASSLGHLVDAALLHPARPRL